MSAEGQQAYQEVAAFMRDLPHMTGVELLKHARKEMEKQWSILIDIEKSRLGAAFSQANWKRAVLVHLAPERFARGGNHACFSGLKRSMENTEHPCGGAIRE